jgi:hypothetical protein
MDAQMRLNRFGFRRALATMLCTLSITGCSSAPLMAPVPKLAERDMDHAVVTFIRSSVMSPTQKAMLWDRETPIGELKPRAYIQYKATPGKHVFLVKSEKSTRWSCLEANLITGEHYAAKIDVVPGGFAARFVFMPLSPRAGDVTRGDMERWLTKLKGQSLIKEMAESYVEQHGGEVRQALSDYEKGKMVPEILDPEDFWPNFP